MDTLQPIKLALMLLRMRGIVRSKGFLTLLVIAIIAAAFPQFTKAASILDASDILSTMQESANSDHIIQFTTPTGLTAGQTITLTFPTGFTLAAESISNWDLATDSDSSCSDLTDQTLSLSGASGATWGFDITGQVVTFTSGTATITAGGCAVIEAGTVAGGAASTIVNQTAAQNASDSTIEIDGTMADSGSIAVEIVADNSVSVTATVDPSITCTFTGLTTNFASLTTGAISTSDTNTTITVSSNANSGVNVTVYDAGNATNPGLYKSAGTTHLIASTSATLAAGTDGYGIQGSSSGGSGAALTVQSPYNVTSNQVGGLEAGASNATPIATSTGALASRILTVVHKAAVSGLAPAGSYADTVTYVCTGVF